jgi:hypothetical protein
MTNTLRSLYLLAVTAVMATTAQAAPITYNFTGTKTSGDEININLGNTIVGTVTLDPSQAAAYYGYYGDGNWYDDGFSINAITDTGYITGTALGLGGRTTYTSNNSIYYNGDQINWQVHTSHGDTAIDKVISIDTYSAANPDADGIAVVANPWDPMAAEYQSISIWEETYNWVTGEHIYGRVVYKLTSFATAAPPDTISPTFTSLTPSVATLSPPNHQMVPITLAAVTSDNVGVVSTKIISATSSEPDNGLGDGDTANDIQITGDLTLSLRAERSGKGNGRTYTITVEAADAAGNRTQMRTTVSVSKSQSTKK